MIQPIVKLGDPRLRAQCEPVDDPSTVAGLIADLRDTVRDCRATTGYGRGIAAPQIGVAARVVYLDLPKQMALINPAIVARSSETAVVWDACLSFLEVFCQVVRHREVTVRFQDEHGTWQELHATGDLSELLQHEIDHLDGILAVDRMTDPRSLCLREEFEARHARDTTYAASG